MSTPRLRMRQGDRLPSFSAQLLDEDGSTPINLTNARCYLQLRPLRGEWAQTNESIEQTGWHVVECLVSDAPNGKVGYDWLQEDADLFAVGTYELVVQVRYLNGDRFDIPSDDRCELIVTPEVAYSLVGNLQTTTGINLLTVDGEDIFTTESAWVYV